MEECKCRIESSVFKGVGLLGVKVLRPSGSLGHLYLSGEKLHGSTPRYYSTCNIEIRPALLDSN